MGNQVGHSARVKLDWYMDLGLLFFSLISTSSLLFWYFLRSYSKYFRAYFDLASYREMKVPHIGLSSDLKVWALIGNFPDHSINSAII
jgi:hypothetical protein